ncbi:hypothetical protein D3C72_1078350 [compost metagenome]
MRGLAAGRRAGVQHPHAVGRRQQLSRQLRARILHRPPAFGKAGQLRHGLGAAQHHAGLANRLRFQACGFEGGQYLFAAGAAAVDAQSQGCRHIGRFQNPLPVLRVGDTQLLDPPAGVVPLRLGAVGHRGFQRRAFAQKTAQASIEHAFERRQAAGVGGGCHGLVHHRMGRVDRHARQLRSGLALFFQQRQRHQQQRFEQHAGIALHQFPAHGIGPTQVAHRMKRHRLGGRAQGNTDVGQRVRQGTAVQHALDHPRAGKKNGGKRGGKMGGVGTRGHGGNSEDKTDMVAGPGRLALAASNWPLPRSALCPPPRCCCSSWPRPSPS